MWVRQEEVGLWCMSCVVMLQSHIFEYRDSTMLFFFGVFHWHFVCFYHRRMLKFLSASRECGFMYILFLGDNKVHDSYFLTCSKPLAVDVRLQTKFVSTIRTLVVRCTSLWNACKVVEYCSEDNLGTLCQSCDHSKDYACSEDWRDLENLLDQWRIILQLLLTHFHTRFWLSCPSFQQLTFFQELFWE